MFNSDFNRFPMISYVPGDDSFLTQSMNSSGLSTSPIFFTPTLEERSSSVLDYGAIRLLPRDMDPLGGSPDDEIFQDMDQAMLEQKVLTREAHLAALSAAINNGYSDTDSSSSAERQALNETATASTYSYYGFKPISNASMPNHTFDSPKRANVGPGKKKRINLDAAVSAKRKRTPKAAPAVPAIPLAKLKGPIAASTHRGVQVSASKQEFDKTLQELPTPVLQCLVKEIADVREGKERVHIFSGKIPDQALVDTDGRPFIFKKVLPHQHKPEKVGDPSPRCLACAARVVHDRAATNLKGRRDVDHGVNFMTPENIDAARKIIMANVGLPADTKVFEYELVGETPTPVAAVDLHIMAVSAPSESAEDIPPPAQAPPPIDSSAVETSA